MTSLYAITYLVHRNEISYNDRLQYVYSVMFYSRTKSDVNTLLCHYLYRTHNGYKCLLYQRNLLSFIFTKQKHRLIVASSNPFTYIEIKTVGMAYCDIRIKFSHRQIKTVTESLFRYTCRGIKSVTNPDCITCILLWRNQNSNTSWL